jgi:streptogramin lyase/plastocyanin
MRPAVLIRQATGSCLLLLGLLVARLAAAASVEIKMTDAPPYFDKPSVDIRVGDTVTWSNTGPEMVHVVMDGDLTLFSQDITVGKSWSHVFTKAGVYRYICHRHFFMRGQITVHNSDGTTSSPPDFPYQRAFHEFVIPTMQSVPRMIIPSKVDQRMWFTEGGGDFYGFEDIPAQNKVASIDADGHIVEYATPTPDSDGGKIGVDSLVMNDAGEIFFTERLTNRIGVLDAKGAIKEFQIPTKNGYALGVDIDRNNNIWFAERYGNRIGYIDRAGKITEIELPSKESEPRTIFVDSRHRIWYTARVANEIAYFDPDVQEFVRLQIPTKEARPAGIAEAPDGTIYFVEMVGNKVAKVMGKEIVEYSLPTAFAAPFKIAPDSSGHLWFTEVYASAIGRFDLKTGQITEYKTPTLDSRPGGIAVDHAGRVWFTQQMGNKIAYLDQTQLSQSEASAARPTSVAAPVAGTSDVPTHSPKREEPSPPPAATGAEVINFRVPTPGGAPGNTLVEDDRGWLWFTQLFGNKIGAINRVSHDFREIELPRPVSMPTGLCLDPHGPIWVVEFRGNALARIAPSNGQLEEFALPWPNTLPTAVTLDEHGAVWVALMRTGSIARFDPATHSFTLVPLPEIDSNPLFLAADNHGGIWVSVAKDGGGYVARFDIQHKRFRTYKTVDADATPVGLLMDGTSLWVAEGGSGYLSRLDPRSGRWDRHRIPGEESGPVRLAKDGEGRIWIADGGSIGSSGGNKLAVFDPRTASFQVIPMAVRDAKPMAVYSSSDGAIWFTQQGANRISMIPAHGV